MGPLQERSFHPLFLLRELRLSLDYFHFLTYYPHLCSFPCPFLDCFHISNHVNCFVSRMSNFLQIQIRTNIHHVASDASKTSRRHNFFVNPVDHPPQPSLSPVKRCRNVGYHRRLNPPYHASFQPVNNLPFPVPNGRN